MLMSRNGWGHPKVSTPGTWRRWTEAAGCSRGHTWNGGDHRKARRMCRRLGKDEQNRILAYEEDEGDSDSLFNVNFETMSFEKSKIWGLLSNSSVTVFGFVQPNCGTLYNRTMQPQNHQWQFVPNDCSAVLYASFLIPLPGCQPNLLPE